MSNIYSTAGLVGELQQRFALRWYAQVLATVERSQSEPQQLMLAVA